MKITPIILFIVVWLFSMDIALAALPGLRESSDIALPSDTLSATTRGTMTLCDSRKGVGGRKGLTFMQIDQAACPGEPQKAVGWDRPQVEPVSPGVPFQDQGIERY